MNKRTKYRLLSKAIAMGLTATLLITSGIPVFAEEGASESVEEIIFEDAVTVELMESSYESTETAAEEPVAEPVAEEITVEEPLPTEDPAPVETTEETTIPETTPEPETVPVVEDPDVVSDAETEPLSDETTDGTETSETEETSQDIRENRADWDTFFSQIILTGDWQKDLLAVAKTQIGTEESKENFTPDNEGRRFGYTRYVDFAGASYKDWSASFVLFCLHYANIDANKVWGKTDVKRWAEDVRDRIVSDTSQAQPGDLVFLSLDADSYGAVDHIGIVSQIIESQVSAIVGDSNGKVEEKTWYLNDPALLGYVDLKTVWEEEYGEVSLTEEEEATEAEETEGDPEETETAEELTNPESWTVESNNLSVSLTATDPDALLPGTTVMLETGGTDDGLPRTLHFIFRNSEGEEYIPNTTIRVRILPQG